MTAYYRARHPSPIVEVIMISRVLNVLQAFPEPLLYAGLIVLPFTWIGSRLLFNEKKGRKNNNPTQDPCLWDTDSDGDSASWDSDESSGDAGDEPGIFYYKLYKKSVNPHCGDAYHITLLNQRTREVYSHAIHPLDESSVSAIAEVLEKEADAVSSGRVYLVTYDLTYQEVALRQLLQDHLDLADTDRFRFVDLRLCYFYVFDDKANTTLADICKDHGMKDRKKRVTQFRDVFQYLLKDTELDIESACDIDALVDSAQAACPDMSA